MDKGIIRTIRKDLIESLKHLDKDDYVVNSISNHIEEQCTEEEAITLETLMYKLPVKEYNDREDFIEDYQPILDIIDFPLKECFRIMDKRTLKESDFDFF